MERLDARQAWRRWPKDIKAHALQLAKAGDSAGRIAEKLRLEVGYVTTRNAVIGIVHRSGLNLRGSQNHSRVTAQSKRRAAAAKLVTPQRASSPPIFRTHPLPFPQPEDIPRIAFADLEDRHCRYPCLLEPGAPDVPQFCGKPKISGSSYCNTHKRVCEGVPVSRRVRPPSEAPALVFGASKFEIETV